MPISDDKLREFIAIWKKQFGEDITLDQARERSAELLEFYKLLSWPLPEKEQEENDERAA